MMCYALTIRECTLPDNTHIQFQGCSIRYFSMGFFYVFLTVRLRIILVGNQLDAQFLL